MLALSRCLPALRWRLPLCWSAVPVGRSPMSSRPSTTKPQFVTTQTAWFHQSRAKASPDPKITSVSAFWSGLEEELLGMGVWSVGLGAVGAALAGIFLANTDICLPKGSKASLEYLEDADLHSTVEDDKIIKAKILWRKNGAVVMAEASELSSLKPQLEELGVPLVAVVKENLAAEIEGFRPHFAGDIYIDEQKRFYGPLQRRMGGLAFFRFGVWRNFFRAWKSGYKGNMNGEGFILGGVFVIGPGNQGILLEHQEKEFGDKVDIKDVLQAVKKIVPEK